MASSASLNRKAKRNLIEMLTSGEMEDNDGTFYNGDVDDINEDYDSNFTVSVDNIDYYSDPDSIESEAECYDSYATSDIEVDSEIEEQSDITLEEELLIFYKISNVSRNVMQYLLNILRKANIDVPKTVYLLTKKTVNPICRELDDKNGKITHFGLKESLKNTVKQKTDLFNDSQLKQGDTVKLCVRMNVDGLPIFKSSIYSIWAMLAIFCGVSARPIPIAVYYGKDKPSAEKFLVPVAEELKDLMTEGILVSGIRIVIKSIFFNVDAPARSYVCGIKGHTAKLGCGYCRSEGTYYDHRVVYSTVCSASRTDESYRRFEENNQVVESPFLVLDNFGLRSGCPPDYQHLICLGIVRKLFFYYFTPNNDKRCRVRRENIRQLSDRTELLLEFWPKHFQRRPRRIDNCLVHFKATEYRFHLLYLFFLLKDVLPENYYKHFLCLHSAVYILSSDHVNTKLHLAEQLLSNFVSQMPILFGKQSVTYNVHCLLHISEFCETLGTLDNFSTFPFENFLSHLKRRVKKTRSVFKHTVNQLHMMKLLSDSDDERPITYAPNDCIEIDSGASRVWIICESIVENLCAGYKLRFSRCLYEDRVLKSVDLGIGLFVKTRMYLSGSPQRKAMCFPKDDEYILIPLVKS